MTDVKWIKITTDIFDDEKILLIENLPEGDSIIVIWFKLLCLAGKMNNSGVFVINDKIAYTDKMLATIFRRKESTVQLALNTFEQFGMIEKVEGVITIPNWGKHQSLDMLEKKREYQKNYMRDYREKQQEKICKTNSKSNCKTNSKANVRLVDIDKEKEEEIEKDKEDSSSDLEWFIETYNSICISLPKVIKVTDKRRKAINKIMKQYNDDDIIKVFNNTENSDFLKGNNEKGWKADIDFILREDKFVNILENKYGSKSKKSSNFILEGKSVKYSEEELKEQEEWRKEMQAKGEQTRF